MMYRQVFKWSLATLALVSLWCSPAVAASPFSARVGRDFKPLSGYVIMPVNGQFLIDLDASRGVSEGDLFSVVTPGKKIIHPVTGKVIGTLDKVKGLLEVTQVRSGYSYARPVGKSSGIGKGDAIRRFEDMDAVFWDYTGEGEPVFSALRDALPQLAWRNFAAAQANRPAKPAPSASGNVALTFILTSRSLTVRGPDFQVIHAYPLPDGVLPTSVASQSTAVQVSKPMASTVPVPVPSVPSGIVPAASAPAVQGTSSAPAGGSSAIVRDTQPPAAGVWKSPIMKGKPVGIAVADLDGDGKLETAVAFADHLEIYRLEKGHLTTLAHVPFETAKAVELDDADLNGDGRHELYVTAAFDNHLRSLEVAWRGTGYQVVRRNIPWYFRTVALPGEGRVLCAERMGEEDKDYEKPVFRVKLSGGDLAQGPTFKLPFGVDLYGFVPFQGAHGNTLLASLSESDYLQVMTLSGDKLWKSGDHFGGREASIKRPDTGAPAGSMEFRYVFPKARIGIDGNNEILVPANEGSRIMARNPSFGSSRLMAMQWDGYTLRQVWHTQPLEGYLADFRLADIDNDGHPEAVLAEAFTSGTFLHSTRSALFAYKLQ